MKRIFLSLVLVLTTFVFSANAQVLKSDSLALVDLYNSTNGANWVNKWDLHTPLSGWYGVTVNNSRVTQLQMGNDGDNNLVGTLPNNIGNLTSLTYLGIFSQPHLTGNIPSSIGKLIKLTGLNFEQNNLSGSIPSSIGNLTLLNYLQANENPNLSGSLPASFAKLINLAEIFMWNCNLSGSVKVLESIPHPFDFEFSNNHLSGPLPKLQNMGNMAELDFDNNEFNGSIPDNYGDFVKLGGGPLSLNNNKLTGKIPQTFGINLTGTHGILAFSHNLLNGPVPANLSNLPYWEIVLQNNKFNFDSIETVIETGTPAVFEYSPQATIPIKLKGKMLSVNAGGTLSNDTFHWYKNGVLVSTKTGNEKYRTTGAGSYNVVVTNKVATQLTLYSDTITVSGLAADAGSFTQNQKAVLLYPNPTKDILNIALSASQNEKAEIQIVDVNGKIVLNKSIEVEAGTSTQAINVSTLAKGNYFAEIKTKEGVKSLKFVKE